MNDKMKWVIFALAFVVAVIALKKLFKGVAVVTEVAGNVTDNFGLTESEKAAKLKTLDCFKPSYYKGIKNAKIMTLAGAKILAEKIYDSRTLKIYTNDDEILGAFKQLKNWAQISFLCDVFYKEYSQDLLMFFWSYMQDRYKRQLFDFINSLPKK